MLPSRILTRGEVRFILTVCMISFLIIFFILAPDLVSFFHQPQTDFQIFARPNLLMFRNEHRKQVCFKHMLLY